MVILESNRSEDFDGAFLRRIRFVVPFPSPDSQSRERIWRGIFPPEARLGALDFNALARMNVAGGSIRNIALDACTLAASEASAVEMRHVVQAALREYDKDNRTLLREELGPYYPNDES